MKEFIRRLQECSKGPKPAELASAILDYEEKKASSPQTSLWQFGITPAKELCNASIKAQDTDYQENAIAERAVRCLMEVESGKKSSHKGRKESIESALNLLMKLYKGKGDSLPPKIFILIARAYLLRSIIIRPKGITIPEKKKEAIRKGLTFINKAIEKLKSSPAKEMLEDAWRIKGQLFLEDYRVDKDGCDKDTPKDFLENALLCGCDKFDKNTEDVRLAILYSELTKSRDYLEQIISSPLEGIEFEKARAYKLLGNEQGIRRNMEVIIEQLSWFSDPLWEDAVEFIDKLRYEGKEYWKDFALAIYKACQEQEAETENLHLRWYWSRQRKLYDLAFVAANSPEEKAQIADSLKSRPSLRWSALEAMGKGNDQIAKMLEDEAKAMLGGYIKRTPKRQRKSIPKTDTQPFLTDIPQGWIAIHFYVNQLENECHALIYNKDENTWHPEFVKEYQKLFQAFLTWQTNYSHSKEQAANYLVQLCKEIGNAMPFLFNEQIIPKGRNVLFIPHDFLHRLPLHGAIKMENNEVKEVFLENHPCCYLPAWSLAGKGDDFNVNGRILLKNFPEYDYKDISEQQYWTSPVKDSAAPDDLRKIDTPPQLLVILCHGQADAVNPFNARLKLTGNGISRLEILQAEKMNLKGSRIILGACETDLVPPLGDVVDEHLSIATAFLTNGATEILGTMWEARPEDIEEIIELLSDINNKENKLWNWQKVCIRDYRAGDPDMFYRGVAFRITGLTI